ncbi:hypothetical protein Cgig2_004295 [Carnegiea gigantea]|uniref:Uncharacterized protein n=1 Tax=Carnegiea gigantea TaxID=171969 RepID=A0A9Q1GTG6_9CARY|nr:hypothetical protein Cgig2_004295 [Carnegiea gigantea]
MAPKTKGLKASTSPWKPTPSTSKPPKPYLDRLHSDKVPESPSDRSSSPPPRSMPGASQTMSDSITIIDATQSASPTSSAADDISFSMVDTPAFITTKTPTVTPPLSSATSRRPTPTNTGVIPLAWFHSIRTILPKPTSTNCVNTRTLELIYLLMTGKPINFARYILGSMSNASSIVRLTPLPYANLWTLVYNHFGMCLDHEIREIKPVPIITLACLKNIPFFKTDTGDWKFDEDMTHEELVCVSKKFGQHVKPCLTSPQSTPPSSLLDHILTLDKRETADKLEYIFVQHTDVLDGRNTKDLASLAPVVSIGIEQDLAG